MRERGKRARRSRGAPQAERDGEFLLRVLTKGNNCFPFDPFFLSLSLSLLCSLSQLLSILGAPPPTNPHPSTIVHTSEALPRVFCALQGPQTSRASVWSTWDKAGNKQGTGSRQNGIIRLMSLNTFTYLRAHSGPLLFYVGGGE